MNVISINTARKKYFSNIIEGSPLKFVGFFVLKYRVGRTTRTKMFCDCGLMLKLCTFFKLSETYIWHDSQGVIGGQQHYVSEK